MHSLGSVRRKHADPTPGQTAGEIPRLAETEAEIAKAEKAETLSKIPRLAYTTEETAAALGVRPTTVWRLTKRGLLKPNRATRIPLYPVSEINRFLEAR